MMVGVKLQLNVGVLAARNDGVQEDVSTAIQIVATITSDPQVAWTVTSRRAIGGGRCHGI